MYDQEESVKWIAERLGVTPDVIGPDCENILVNNDVWKKERFVEDLPDDYPYGWCNKKQWDKFVAAHPDDYWFPWVEMLEENIDYYLEYDAVKLKER